jgi:hypothetical protein
VTSPPAIGRARVRIELGDDDALFFVHVPKTGGMSLISVLERQFRPDEIFPPHSFVGRAGFEAYGPLQRSRFKLVRAHLHAGSHSDVCRYIAASPLCLTMLREPAERLVSAYKHILRHRDNPLHEELVGKRVSLLDYVTDAAYAQFTTNFQTWMVLGALNCHLDPRDVRLPEDTRLALARQRLEQFAFVGLTHRFAESLELLCHTFGWPRCDRVPLENVAPERTVGDAIDPRVRAAILERNRLDVELLALAERLFDARFTRMLEERDRARA